VTTTIIGGEFHQEQLADLSICGEPRCQDDASVELKHEESCVFSLVTAMFAVMKTR
jgi:hypothetical protein